MATYVGKNNGEAIFHATAGTHTDEEIQNTVQRDTLFHSKLPYLITDQEYEVTRDHITPYDSNWSFTASVFNIPADMQVDLASGFMFIAVAKYADGRTFNVSVDTPGVSMQQWVSDGTGSMDTRIFCGTGVHKQGGFFYSDSTNIATYDDIMESPFRLGTCAKTTSSTALTVALAGSKMTYLNRYSKSLVYLQSSNGFDPYGYDGCSEVTAVTFYRLNLKNTHDAPYTYIPIFPGGKSTEIELTNSKLEVNGSDYLSDIKYLAYTGVGVSGATVTKRRSTATAIPGTVMAPATYYNGFPYFSAPMVASSISAAGPTFAINGLVYFGGVAANGKISVDASTNMVQNVGGSHYDLSTVNSTLTGIRAGLIVPLYEFTPIPTITSVEFTNDSLTLNKDTATEFVMYSPTVGSTAMVGPSQRATCTGFTRSLTGDTTEEVLEDTLTFAGTWGTREHFLYSFSSISTGTFSCFNTARRYSNAFSWSIAGGNGNTPELGMKMVSLADGECAPIGGTFLNSIENTSGHINTYLVYYVLKREGASLELRTVSKQFNFGNDTAGTMTVAQPTFAINVVRMYGN